MCVKRLKNRNNKGTSAHNTKPRYREYVCVCVCARARPPKATRPVRVRVFVTRPLAEFSCVIHINTPPPFPRVISFGCNFCGWCAAAAAAAGVVAVARRRRSPWTGGKGNSVVECELRVERGLCKPSARVERKNMSVIRGGRGNAHVFIFATDPKKFCPVFWAPLGDCWLDGIENSNNYRQKGIRVSDKVKMQSSFLKKLVLFIMKICVQVQIWNTNNIISFGNL